MLYDLLGVIESLNVSGIFDTTEHGAAQSLSVPRLLENNYWHVAAYVDLDNVFCADCK